MTMDGQAKGGGILYGGGLIDDLLKLMMMMMITFYKAQLQLVEVFLYLVGK